jgi:hypothetical protein
MSLEKFERKNTIQADVTFQTGGVDTDPYNNEVYISVIKPNGNYMMKGESAARTGTGDYRYYISTQSTDPLGIYIVQWSGQHDTGGSQGYVPLVQRDAFQLVDTEQD